MNSVVTRGFTPSADSVADRWQQALAREPASACGESAVCVDWRNHKRDHLPRALQTRKVSQKGP